MDDCHAGGYEALHKNDTWDLVRPPKGKNVFSLKMGVQEEKRNTRG